MPTASPEAEEADSSTKCQTQEEIEPDMGGEGNLGPNSFAEHFLSEEHHFQKHLTHCSEKQALIGSIVTVKRDLQATCPGNH